MQLFKCVLLSGHSKIRYFVSFDQNHIQNLLKAQENINTAQNMDQLINYQLQLDQLEFRSLFGSKVIGKPDILLIQQSKFP
ncbi:hypothetical protein pb186bvf_011779 [Paramecium bursaria]